jgi:hypothetical protein
MHDPRFVRRKSNCGLPDEADHLTGIVLKKGATVVQANGQRLINNL